MVIGPSDSPDDSQAQKSLEFMGSCMNYDSISWTQTQ